MWLACGIETPKIKPFGRDVFRPVPLDILDSARKRLVVAETPQVKLSSMHRMQCAVPDPGFVEEAESCLT
jgi:hypothetical protein